MLCTDSIRLTISRATIVYPKIIYLGNCIVLRSCGSYCVVIQQKKLKNLARTKCTQSDLAIQKTVETITLICRFHEIQGTTLEILEFNKSKVNREEGRLKSLCPIF